MLNCLKLEQINPISINLTGIRLLVIFSLLLESPKTAEEINEYFEINNYPKECFSIDTLRNDLNALRYAGCEITRADKTNDYKYKLLAHPFELDIDETEVLNLSKLYKKAYIFLDIPQLINLENLFNLLANYTKKESVSEELKGISLLKDIDKELLKTLLTAGKNKNIISFNYK